MEVAIITGASSGIGKGLAELLASKNIKVYGISRSKIQSEKIINISADITNEKVIENVIKDIFDKEKRIDYLINNAGMGISGSIEATNLEDLKQIIDVNFVGLFIMTKYVLKYMRKQKKGRIINIGSVASEFSIPFQSFYSSTKAAVKSFSQSLQNEVSCYGINVTTILPGDVATSFTKNRKKNENELNVYKSRVNKSIDLMAKDEQNGMSISYVSNQIYKIMKKKKMPIQKTIGFKYKIFMFIKRFLPNNFVNYLVGKIYAFKKEGYNAEEF